MSCLNLFGKKQRNATLLLDLNNSESVMIASKWALSSTGLSYEVQPACPGHLELAVEISGAFLAGLLASHWSRA